jgi:hypothetical protein
VNPAALRFFINGPAHWGAVITARVEQHFRTLKLAQLYSAEAADELLNIRHQLQGLFAIGGAEMVRAELEDRAESCQHARSNGWRTATFEALASSDWFYDGGFA